MSHLPLSSSPKPQASSLLYPVAHASGSDLTTLPPHHLTPVPLFTLRALICALSPVSCLLFLLLALPLSAQANQAVGYAGTFPTYGEGWTNISLALGPPDNLYASGTANQSIYASDWNFSNVPGTIRHVYMAVREANEQTAGFEMGLSHTRIDPDTDPAPSVLKFSNADLNLGRNGNYQ